MQFISRVVGGWQVRMMRDGKRTGRFFADSKHGGKRKSLAEAVTHRDELLRTRVMKQSKPRPLLISRSGNEYWQIRIPQGSGKSTTTEFSVRRHGVRKAKQLALEAYDSAATHTGPKSGSRKK